MKWIEDLRQWWGRYSLKRIKVSSVSRYSRPWASIDKIAVLYEASRDNMEIIKKYTTSLRNEGKKVFELGYFDALEPVFDINYTLHSEFITKKQLGSNKIPVRDAAIGFRNEEFDLLINLYTEEILPLMYISHTSKAKFRIGHYNPRFLPYVDMLIDTGNKNSLDELVQQINIYIHKL